MADAVLHLGDCREVMPGIPDASVDAVIVDPPFGIVNRFAPMGTYRSVDGVKTGTRTMRFDWDGPEITAVVVEALALAFTKLKRDGAAFVFCGFDQAGEIRRVMCEAGFTVKPAAWVKTCPPPAAPGNWWPSGFELAAYGYRPGAWFGDTDPERSNVFVGDSMRHGQPGKTGHPTQKPLWIMKKIVESICPPAGIVLDPFAGSGTTLVACLKTGRRGIGIEIDPKYHAIAERRLAGASTPLLDSITPDRDRGQRSLVGPAAPRSA